MAQSASIVNKPVTYGDVEYQFSVETTKEGLILTIKDMDHLQTFISADPIPSSRILMVEIESALDRKHQRKFELGITKEGVDFIFVVDDPFRPVKESFSLKKQKKDKDEEMRERVERVERKLKKLEKSVAAFIEKEEKAIEQEKKMAEEKKFRDQFGLAGDHLEALAKLLDKDFTKSSKLLFRASRDGFSNSSFHSRCDNKGSVLILAKTATGYVFGGYTAQSWTSGGQYIQDPNAFLFALADPNGSKKSEKCVPYQNLGNGVYHNAGYGPTFGGGHDLYINLDSMASSYSNLGYTYRAPNGVQYGNQNAQAYLAGSYNGWTLSELEVYQI